MTRTIGIELNKFPSIPATLVNSTTKTPLNKLSVNMKKLFHHYFLAKYGDDANDTGVYEYERMLTTGSDWRFRGAGIGGDKESKRNASNELGKAFARWFLDEHLSITYFCPLEYLLGRKNPDGTQWKRKDYGDLPDYVCGKTNTDVNLLEAKGRYQSVTFRTKEFNNFRAQIQRAQLLDAQGCLLQVKGFISVARWATEDRPRVSSKLLVEDPSTEGEPTGSNGYPRYVGLSMVAGHYAAVLERLQLPLHAEVVRDFERMPEQTGARRGIWKCISGSLSGRRFVGGVLPDRFVSTWGPWWPFLEGVELQRFGRFIRRDSPFVLAPPMRFFGLEEEVFQRVLEVGRRGPAAAAEILPVEVPAHMGSLSLLRDGTVIGPVDYFEPVGIMDL